MMIRLNKDIQGSILDIGGGGEGIIGRLYREQVTAIDKEQEELDEAPDCCSKILMDARSLLFQDNSFDNVTSFYSFMFMLQEDQERVFDEAARVIRAGGYMHIWDAAFHSAYPEPFVAELSIVLGDNLINVSYGIIKNEGQSSYSIIKPANAAGLRLIRSAYTDGHFYLCFMKEAVLSWTSAISGQASPNG